MNFENLLYKVEPNTFDKEIKLPSSKSHANRALIIGARKGKGFIVHNLSGSTDVLTLLNCLKLIGLKVIEEGGSVKFLNSFPECEIETTDEIIDLMTGDGGTTNRFLLALLSLGKKTYRLIPSEKMRERPMDDLIDPLKLLKVQMEVNDPGVWISVQGPAQIETGQKLEINCAKSTQFASGVMLAFSDFAISFDLKNVQASEAYIEMTKYILKQTLNKFSYRVPVDFSSLSYPVALALICGRVLVNNCIELDRTQADSAFIQLMINAGGDVVWTKEGLLVTSKNKLAPFKVDGSKFPDLIPTLAFVASHIEGESVLQNLSVLRHKESDRLEQIQNLLRNLSVNFQLIESRDELIIRGTSAKYRALNLSPARDHRMVMTAYLFLRANNGGSLAEVDCVEKSFPNFFEIMK